MKINAIRKTYEGRTVLDFDGVSLEKGKIYAVLGANGSGKTTLARIAAGIVKPDGKTRPFDGECSVGYMPQKSFAFHASVMKNIMVAADKNDENRKKAERYMERLALSDLRDTRADRLSGGETAKTALIRTMMGDFDVLILDEPTAAMDVSSSLTAEELIKEYASERNACIILVTHSVKQAQRIADKVLFLYEGKLLEYGDTEQVLFSPQRRETIEFLNFYGV